MGTPRYPKSMGSEWQKSQRELRNLFTSANVRKAITQVAAGILDVSGILNIVPGGKFNAKYTNGNSALYMGPVSDGNVMGEGIVFRRGDGTEVLHLEGFSDEASTFAIKDIDENVILADDEMGGLSNPYIPYTFVNTVNVPSNNSGTYTMVGKTWVQKQHPNIELAFYQNTTSTTGQIQFIVVGGSADGTVLATVNTSTGSTTEELSSVELPGEYLEKFYIEVQTRVDSGTGEVGCVVLGAYGTKST